MCRAILVARLTRRVHIKTKLAAATKSLAVPSASEVFEPFNRDPPLVWNKIAPFVRCFGDNTRRIISSGNRERAETNVSQIIAKSTWTGVVSKHTGHLRHFRSRLASIFVRILFFRFNNAGSDIFGIRLCEVFSVDFNPRRSNGQQRSTTRTRSTTHLAFVFKTVRFVREWKSRV